MLRRIRSKVIAPHAGLIIWNYEERTTADNTKKPHDIEKVYVASKHVVSINTTKNKSNPAGTFDIRLAPTINWVAKITPGSWCAILMSTDTPITKESGLTTADRRTLKMFGRIKDVRVAIGVDQETGARNTQYIITGEDWGSIFNTTLYVDGLGRDTSEGAPGESSAVGLAQKILYDKVILDNISEPINIPTSSDNIKALIKLWGAPIEGIESAVGTATKSISTPLISSKSQYKLPTEVVRYFNFGGKAQTSISKLTGSVPSVNFANLITPYEGVLTKHDTYSGDNKEAQGIIAPNSLFGMHTFWQLLVDNCNPTLNELVADIRWEETTPVLALYKRVRPFIVRDGFDGEDQEEVVKNISKFKYIRRTILRKEEVISINACTNINEKINFIEVRPYDSFGGDNYDNEVKLLSQSFDYAAYERDGFKPLIAKPHTLPYTNGPAPEKATQWKYLLREWHFSKDTMLNGAISFIGFDRYIQVGDNIMVDASVLGAPFNETQKSFITPNRGFTGPLKEEESTTGSIAFLNAHVEQVEHQFNVNQVTGARSFTTTVSFVRGVIADINGDVLSSSVNKDSKRSSALNKNSSESTKDDLTNTNVIITSAKMGKNTSENDGVGGDE